MDLRLYSEYRREHNVFSEGEHVLNARSIHYETQKEVLVIPVYSLEFKTQRVVTKCKFVRTYFRHAFDVQTYEVVS